MTYSDPAAYEKFMGRWSARLAPMFLDFAGIEDGQHILDVGCGTGALTVAALAAGSRINVKAIDPVAEYISFARNAVEDRRAEFQVSSVESLPFPDHEFDATLGLLILQDLADPDRSILEMARVTRPSGRVAACQWDFREGFPMLSLLWEAAAAVAPAEVARRKAAGSVQKEADVDTLADQWKRAGLCDVKTAFLEYPMRFRSFDDFWLPFLAGATPTSAFAAALNRETEGELARVLHAKVCGGRSDIAFDLPARALAVVGVNAVPPAR